jgi:glycosyltransferase involved in cell wall biosynthesis
LRFVEKFFYNQYAEVVCISSAVEKSLKSWVGPYAITRIILNGVIMPDKSVIERRSSNLTSMPRLLSVGSLREAKGFDIAIKAIACIKDEIESYTIVGEGEQRQALENIIRQEGLEDKVFLVGWSNCLRDHYLRSDLQLVPSRWEGFGLVCVEGMAYGLPIVASNVDGLNEVVDQSQASVCLIGDYSKPQAWVGPIGEMLSNVRTNRHELALCSRSQAEKFGVDKMISSYEALYREITG